MDMHTYVMVQVVVILDLKRSCLAFNVITNVVFTVAH